MVAATQKSQPTGLAGRREARIAPMIEKLSVWMREVQGQEKEA
jgi:hypothetical protein